MTLMHFVHCIKVNAKVGVWMVRLIQSHDIPRPFYFWMQETCRYAIILVSNCEDNLYNARVIMEQAVPIETSVGILSGVQTQTVKFIFSEEIIVFSERQNTEILCGGFRNEAIC